MAPKRSATIPEVPAKVVWVAVAVPTLAEIKGAARGTAYAFKEAPGQYHLRAKLGANHWLQLCDRTIAKTVAEWRLLVTSPPRMTGYFTSELQVHTELARFPDGLKRLG